MSSLKLGLRAIGENSTCSNIEVGLDGCQVSINGTANNKQNQCCYEI